MENTNSCRKSVMNKAAIVNFLGINVLDYGKLLYRALYMAWLSTIFITINIANTESVYCTCAIDMIYVRVLMPCSCFERGTKDEARFNRMNMIVI